MAIYTESNHRIANNLTLIAGLLQQQAHQIERRGEPLDPAEAAALLGEASVRVAAAGELHRLLSKSGDGAIDLGEFLALVSRQALEAMTDPRQFTLRVDADDCVVAAEIALKYGLVVGELVVNTIKHSHPAQARGLIEVGCMARADGRLEIRVSDDGVGLPDGYDPQRARSTGMRTLRAIVGELKGELKFEDDGLGLTARLIAPLSSNGLAA